jgi:uncharacterized membrane protein
MTTFWRTTGRYGTAALRAAVRRGVGAHRNLGEIGIEGAPSTLATAVRTAVILVVVWTMVVALNEHRAIPTISNGH